MNDIPFDYECFMHEGDINIKRSEFKADTIGIRYWNNQEVISVGYCAIIFYESGFIQEKKEIVTILAGESYVIDGSVIPTAFHNHYMHGKITKMEIIITPFGCTPLKWRVQIIEE